MRMDDVFPSRWLKASDLEGKRCRAVMNKVEMQDFGDDGEKPVVYFLRAQLNVVKEKGLVLNRTNWNTIADMYGDESDAWNGKEITLFATKVPFGRKIVDSIRIDLAPPPRQEAKPSAQQTARPHMSEMQPSPPPASPADYGADMNDEVPW